jgi:hypothetical protein
LTARIRVQINSLDDQGVTRLVTPFMEVAEYCDRGNHGRWPVLDEGTRG